MKLIVGLGNPGAKYEKTRHNLGFMVVEQFLKDFEPVGKTQWDDSSKFKSDIAEIEWQRRSVSLPGEVIEKLILVKPKTYMNNSGLAVSLLSNFYKIKPEDIWVIYDDIDLPLGSMKIRFGGAVAGHHGVESILEALRTDAFWRFRMGIGVNHQGGNGHDGKEHVISKIKMKNVEDYVLGNFIASERGKIKDLIKRGSHALQTALEESLEKATNQFNTK